MPTFAVSQQTYKTLTRGSKFGLRSMLRHRFFAVYHESEDRRTTHLVLTQKAHQTEFGTWAGLDQRIVDRVREIDAQGRGGYDFVKEVEDQNRRAAKAKRDKFREEMGSFGEQAAHAVRKDLGIKRRAFIKDAL